MELYLLKLSELTLKGGNREEFETCLLRNLRDRLRGSGAQLSRTNGRFFVRADPAAEPAVVAALEKVIGLSGWAKARVCAKTPEAVLAACVEEGRLIADSGARTFKIEARRADKSFPLDSYAIMRAAGEAVLAAEDRLRVNVKTPDRTIEVEIREKAFVYGLDHPGRRGLPVGTGGRGLALLSGGIDSPVAIFRMASRGMRLAAVHFHSYPYTSREATEKVVRLAELVGAYCQGLTLNIVPFTAVQLKIKEAGPAEWSTILLRMAMMDAAGRLARRTRAKCLVTGESLGQVASQTIENLTCTESVAGLPVLRPLIGTDKIDIIRAAEDIGTYAVSILPYEDCCVIFSPPHPVLKADLARAKELYADLALDDLIAAALAEREIRRCAYPAGRL
jgi:thiamine biosynthesis protein ThiI